MAKKRKTQAELEAIQAEALGISGGWCDGIDRDVLGVDLGFALQFIMMDALGQLFRERDKEGRGG